MNVRSPYLGLAALLGVACGAAEATSAEDQNLTAKPTKEDCLRLDNYVDACLEENGGIGFDADDCLADHVTVAKACCKAGTYNYCRAVSGGADEKEKPTEAECQQLHDQVDACLEENGGLGWNADDCGGGSDFAAACCTAYGGYNYCQTPK